MTYREEPTQSHLLTVTLALTPLKDQRVSSSFGAIVYRPINRLGSIMYEIVI